MSDAEDNTAVAVSLVVVALVLFILTAIVVVKRRQISKCLCSKINKWKPKPSQAERIDGTGRIVAKQNTGQTLVATTIPLNNYEETYAAIQDNYEQTDTEFTTEHKPFTKYDQLELQGRTLHILDKTYSHTTANIRQVNTTYSHLKSVSDNAKREESVKQTDVNTNYNKIGDPREVVKDKTHGAIDYTYNHTKAGETTAPRNVNSDDYSHLNNTSQHFLSMEQIRLNKGCIRISAKKHELSEAGIYEDKSYYNTQGPPVYYVLKSEMA